MLLEESPGSSTDVGAVLDDDIAGSVIVVDGIAGGEDGEDADITRVGLGWLAVARDVTVWNVDIDIAGRETIVPYARNADAGQRH